MKTKFYLILAVLLGSGLLAYGQHDQFNYWYQYTGKAKLKNNWSLTSVWQYRSFDLKDPRLFLTNNYVEYKLKNAQVRFGGGYLFANIMSYNELGEKRGVLEHRFLQQVTIGNKVSPRFSISHRFRVEERYMFSDKFVVRSRYLFSSKLKLGDINKGRWTLLMKNEVRLNVRRQGTFHSNRVIFGLSYQLTDSLKVIPGFLAQLEAEDPHDYYLTLTLKQSFDFSR